MNEELVVRCYITKGIFASEYIVMIKDGANLIWQGA